MQLIEKTKDLENFCQILNAREFICVDLEFMRERTYFAKLCSIQIASVAESAVIDPLAPGLNLTSFFNLMQAPSVTKVFHSGRQDIEIIYNLCGKIPAPLFDTQIAAQALGFGEAVSYETLVNAVLHIELDKSSRLSDWSKRPLNENQLRYALSDVTHLVNIYQHIRNELQKQHRLDWIAGEIEALANPEIYRVNPREVWQKIRHRSHNALFLTTLRELAAWREQRAIQKNTPRQSVIKDDILLNICAARPETKEELAAVRGVRPDMAAGRIGDEIIAALENVKQLAKKDYVIPAQINPPVTDSSLYELLKLLLRITAQKQKIVPHLLASEDDLKDFCRRSPRDIPFMHGWRYEIFGCNAEKISRGETAVFYNPSSRHFEFIDISKQLPQQV